MGGIRDFTVEETKGGRWDREETDDQRKHKVSNQSVFEGGGNHKVSCLSEIFILKEGKYTFPG